MMGSIRLMGSATSVGVGIVLLCSACTGGDSSAGQDGDNGVVGSTSEQSSTTDTVELLPYDEPITVPEGPDADDDAVDDAAADGTPDTDESPSTTARDGAENTLGSIVPPEDDVDNGNTTTTAVSATTTPPVNGDAEQPLQEESSALACATVELGYLQELGGNDGSERLRDGAGMAISTGVGEYVEAGQGLVDALDADSGLDSAADALLSQCETDGFERLA